MWVPTRILGAAGALALLTLTACNDAKEAREAEASEKPCGSAASAITDTKLPARFPNLDGVVYTATAEQGPSTQVVGYTDNRLNRAFAGMKEKFAAAPYRVVKSEQDAHDAEINFASDEDHVTGQVALSEECKGRLRVRVVVRPQ